jgi:glycosyltransferase involved in cell wall biosynthesis
MYRKNLTIVIPCYNEQHTIGKVVKAVQLSLLTSRIFNYEIIIINDASTDNTLNISKKILIKHKNVKLINNKKNLGLGGSVLKGYKNALGKYCIYVPGDNSHPSLGLIKIFKEINFNKNEIIIPFVKNNNSRHPLRIFLSKSFTFLINKIFFLKIPYYNGLAAYPTKSIKRIRKINADFSFQAQLLILLIKKYKITFKITETFLKEDGQFYSNAIKIKNIINVLVSIFKLRIYLLNHE